MEGEKTLKKRGLNKRAAAQDEEDDEGKESGGNKDEIEEEKVSRGYISKIRKK